MNKNILIGGLAVVAIIAILVAYFAGQNSYNTTQPASTSQTTAATPATAPAAQAQPSVAQPETSAKTSQSLSGTAVNSSQPMTASTNQSQATQPPTYTSNTLTTEVYPRLAVITCGWYNTHGGLLFSQTSNGLLGPEATNGDYFVDTVLGGVMNTSYTGSPLPPSSCTVTFPDGASLYAGGFSTVTVGLTSAGISPVNVANENIDFAQVVITTPNTYLAYYAGKNIYCSTRPTAGDSIEVVGYETSSSGQVLTGAITGTSGYYDTTSIVVPDGMQGSTAVLLDPECIIGQINSSGQIADQQALNYLYGW